MDLEEIATICTQPRWCTELWEIKQERIKRLCDSLDDCSDLIFEIPKRLNQLTNQCLYYEDLDYERETPLQDDLAELEAKIDISRQYLIENMGTAQDDNVEKLFRDLERSVREIQQKL